MLLALAASLLLHVIIVPVLRRLAFNDISKLDMTDAPVIMLEDLVSKGQLVDLRQGEASATAPRDSKYLSDVNRNVEQEQQARATGLPVPPQAPSQGAERTEKGEAAKSKSSPQEDTVSLQQKPPEPKSGLKTQLPQEWLASLAPQAPSNYLPNVNYGDATLLNTREYAFAPFFIRMKQSLERVWNPQRILKQHNVGFNEEFRTAVNIVLNADGSIYSASIVRGSSIDELDQEALRSVYKAAPFVNPPKDLVEANGKITIKDFNFIVTQRPVRF